MADYRMGDLAAEDSYDPFAAEKFLPPVLADQSKFMAGQDVNAVKAIGGGIGDILKIPEQVTQNSQFALDTGTYDLEADAGCGVDDDGRRCFRDGREGGG